FYNFRGDRAIEISKAFESGSDFDKFDRVRVPDVYYAGMLSYDGDLHIPANYLVNPPVIKNTMGENFAASGIKQYAVSETQKYGHVSYFWNGNRSGKFSEGLEVYEEITSDLVPFEQRPWMKCADITDRIISALRSGEYRFLRCNFPNGDMVGHTGNIDATITGVSAVDLMLARILPVIDEMRGIAIITADHGNADEMYETDKTGKPKTGKDGFYKAKTSHTLNPVPCIFYDNYHNGSYRIIPSDNYGLANLAATVCMLLGYEPPEMWEKSAIEIL
ncbi:MAG: 2,3-bisphosphoglycerate-independent phosphoglycerate mutase, partial [Eubacteriales bacterium]|nr:2,3-bisphosphoglycerate-independent phosphoglycerate mutase [Eubacteriales bacterium]